MAAAPCVVGWKEVRNQELSEIVTRRGVVESLSSQRVAELKKRWVQDGLLPGGPDGWERRLAAVLCERLDAPSLTAAALAEMLQRRRAVGLLPPAAAHLSREDVEAAFAAGRDDPAAGLLALCGTVPIARAGRRDP